MKKILKSCTAVFLAVIMAMYTMPLSIFAADTAVIKISSNVSTKDIDADGVEFTYYVEINGSAFDGSAVGSDGVIYYIKDGNLTIPYDVTAEVTVNNGDTYSVKRLEYDNDKYALIDETTAVSGEISTEDYYVTINGKRTQISRAEFNEATDNGANLEVTEYTDADGNSYEADEVESINGQNAYVKSTLGISSYNIEDYSGYAVSSSIKNHTGTLGDIACTHYREDVTVLNRVISSSYYYSNSFTAYLDGEKVQDYSTSKTVSTSMSGTRSSCLSAIDSNQKTAYCVVADSVDDGDTVVITDDIVYTDPHTDVSLSSAGTIDSNYDDINFNIASFISVTQVNAVYEEVAVDADKDITFDATLSSAPTGTFEVDFMVYDGTIPEGYDEAEFEIQDINGNVLTRDVDYTLSIQRDSQKVFTQTIGFTIYRYSGLKHGYYTIHQTAGKAGYIVDSNYYSFEVRRSDGAVVGDNFAKSDFHSEYTALTNNTYSFITKFKVFKNNSFSIKFTKRDQNEDIVVGAKFMMVQRDELFALVQKLATSGVDSLGSMDWNSILEEIQSVDWNSIDVGTILGLILKIVELSPDAIPEITIPAILSATSDSDGVVSFSNSSNILNVLGTLTSSEISGAELAQIIEQYFGSVIPEEYVPYLDSLAQIDKINVNTGIPDGDYILIESEAPTGYERSALIYTVSVGANGTATAKLGIVTPIVVDNVNSTFDVNLEGLLVSPEQFESAKETVGDAFGTFDEYQQAVINQFIEYIQETFGDSISTDQLEEIRDTINDYYNEYGDFADALGAGIQKLNSMITDDVMESWTYYNYRYFVDVPIYATDCEGGTIDGIQYEVYDSNGDVVELESDGKSVSLPFGTYTFKVTYVPDGYVLIDDSVVSSVTVDDANGSYSFISTYHHPGDAYDITVEPTCTEDGSVTTNIDCTICKETLSSSSVKIDKKGHTNGEAVEENRVEPTCTTVGGYDTVVYCTVCGAELDRQHTELEKIAHNYVQTVTEPTCTDEGFTTFVCSECGDTYKDLVTNPNGHTNGDAVEENRVEPTCTTVGGYDTVVYCTVCGAELDRQHTELEKIAHNYVQTVTEPTCTDEGFTTFVCSECGDTYKDLVTNPNGHTNGDAVEENRVEPTCTEKGSYDVVTYCTVCDAEISRDTKKIDAKGHTSGEAVEENRVEPTCTDDGSYDVVTYCTVCDTELSRETKKIDAKGHTNGEAVEENRVEPTCTDDGSYDVVTYCTVCDAEISRETKKINAKGHTSGEAVEENRTEPTCTDDGSYDVVIYCTVCGTELSRDTKKIDAKGHTSGEAVEENRVEPTCTTVGGYDTVVYCTVCGAELERQHTELEKVAHNYIQTVTEPTCTDEGFTTFVCSECGDTYKDLVTNPNGHTSGETVKENIVDPTCTEKGSYDNVVYCTVCDNEISRETIAVAANGHTSGEAVEENRTEPTCTDDGSYDVVTYCTVCDAELSRETKKINAKGHTNGEAVEENRVEPTCTDDGSYDVVTYCTVCDAEISRETKKINAKGHTNGEAVEENRVEPTCTDDGSYDVVTYCTVCGTELSRETITIAATGHTLGDWVVTKDATESSTGEQQRSCVNCDYFETKVIPMNESKVVVEESNRFTVNGKLNSDDVEYVVDDNDQYKITVTYTGEGELVGWTNNFADLGLSSDDFVITYNDESMILELVSEKAQSSWDNGEIVINAEVEYEDEETTTTTTEKTTESKKTTTKKNSSKLSPATGNSVAGATSLLITTGLMIILAKKRRKE